MGRESVGERNFGGKKWICFKIVVQFNIVQMKHCTMNYAAYWHKVWYHIRLSIS